MQDIEPRDATETRALAITDRILTAIPTILTFAGGLLTGYASDSIPLLITGLTSLIAGGATSYIAIRRIRSAK